MELFIKYPIQVQDECLSKLIAHAKHTEFGLEHGFKDVQTVHSFRERVPISEYGDLKPYIDRQLKGGKNLLWPGEVTWFAKSSGTTSSRSKFIPVTKESLEDCHFKGGKDMLSIYCHNNPEAHIFLCLLKIILHFFFCYFKDQIHDYETEFEIWVDFGTTRKFLQFCFISILLLKCFFRIFMGKKIQN